MTQPPPDQWLTPKQASKEFQLSPYTLRRLRERRLVTIREDSPRRYSYSRNSIIQWQKENTLQAIPENNPNP